METIFDNVERAYEGHAKHGEPTFTFLNRSSRSCFGRVRDLIEDWFSHIPAKNRADLRSRLRSKNGRTFSAAFWELYCHESLIRLGYSVTIHPSVPGADATPDFRAEKGKEQLYVESRLVADEDLDTEAAASRRDKVYEVLDSKLHSPNFFLGVDAHSIGPAALAANRLVSELSSWLRGLDPDEVHQEFERSGRAVARLPVYVWQNAGWKLVFRAQPKAAERRGKPGVRPLGVFGEGGAKVVDGSERILGALGRKARKYGALEQPYVVALMCVGHFVEQDDLDAALFGKESMEIRVGLTGQLEGRPIREANGFWGNGSAPRNTRVSAVLTVFNLEPWKVAEREPLVVHNPWASQRLGSSLPWRALVFDPGATGLLEQPARSTPLDVFNLAAGWPMH